MKKYLSLLILPILLLSSCGGDQIECSSIKIDSLTYSFTYGTQEIFKYSCEDGSSLYTTRHFKYQKSGSSYSYEYADSVINLYDNHFDYIGGTDYSGSRVYTFDKFVGFVGREQHVYYSASSRVVDLKSDYVELPTEYGSTLEPKDNKEAYSSIKKSGLWDVPQSYPYSEQYIVIFRDLIDFDCEKHTYVQVGSTSVVTYVEK